MRVFLASLLLLVMPGLHAAQVEVEGVRIWAAPDNTRVVFDLSAPIEHQLLNLDDPHRLVIDIKQARLDTVKAQPDSEDNYLAQLRSSPRNGTDLRIVLDLKQQVASKSFLLKPNQRYGHRLVVDISAPDGPIADDPATPKHTVPKTAGLRDVVIAIDPGHGGEDPGAIGPNGTREKDVVLAMARRLADRINRERGMHAVLTRDGDYFLPLRRRIEIARQHQADLFISVHADAFRDRRVHGSSVYVLSRRGASSEMARLLAERENAADLVGGVSLDDKDDTLRAVLLDLSQTGTLEASIDVAERLIQGLSSAGRVHRQQVQSAGFMVLKAPDIPSVLVETGFISNPDDERRLRDPNHQDRLANSMLEGLRNYFARHAPPGTLLAEQPLRRHVISRGETLSTIAQQYRVSQAVIMQSNNLNDDRIRVGQTLVIPGGGG